MCVALVTVHYWCPKITGVLLRDNPERLQFWSRPRMSAPASMSCHNPPLKPNSGPAYDGGRHVSDPPAPVDLWPAIQP